MRYIATGKVHPERCAVYFGAVQMQFGQAGRAVASCAASQLTVVLEDTGADGRHAAVIQAEQLASIVTHCLAYSLGYSYHTEITQVIAEDGVPHVYGAMPIADGAEALGYGEAEGLAVFNRALHLAGSDLFFRFAVSDFVQAVGDTADCATYCYRAVESLKSGIGLRTGDSSWQRTHVELGTTRDQITTIIKQYADPVRHGNWIAATPTTGAQRLAMLQAVRDAVRTYLDKFHPTEIEPGMPG